ncbi:MAG: DUF4384 domain-containing protein [Candidatus Eisenbacteria bacterium]
MKANKTLTKVRSIPAEARVVPTRGRIARIPVALTIAVLAVGILSTALGIVSPSYAIEPERGYVAREPRPYNRHPLVIDVWTNKGEGAVYRPGEGIKVYFRASRDCYVTLYNIDSDGYVHLLYPSRPFDSHHVTGGVTYRIPSHQAPFDLVVSGPPGIEYVEAVASVQPFQRGMPWYLDPEYGEWEWQENPWYLFGDDYEYYADDYDYYADRGMVRGDPFLGIQRINRRIIGPDYPPEHYATAYTSFYVGRRVSYPGYLCYDCHWHHPYFDPYGAPCMVIDIRLDRTWVYSPRIVVRDHKPMYYYRVKEGAPVRYKGKRNFYSSGDGLRVLKSEFSAPKPEWKPGQPKWDTGKETKWSKEPVVPQAREQFRQWKPGKAPSSQKLDGLKKRLETEGVLKPKTPARSPEKDEESYKKKEELKTQEKSEQKSPKKEGTKQLKGEEKLKEESRKKDR